MTAEAVGPTTRDVAMIAAAHGRISMTAKAMGPRPEQGHGRDGCVRVAAGLARPVFGPSPRTGNIDPTVRGEGPAGNCRPAPATGGGRQLPEWAARSGFDKDPARPAPARGPGVRGHRRLGVSVRRFGERRAPVDRLRRHEGFTLVELAIVIAIVGFLLGAFLAPLRAQIDAARVRETERMLDEIREALIGYTIIHGALPCPDIVSDGIDGAAPPACTGTALEGILPFQALGVRRADAWGRLLRYRITEEFSNRSLTGQPSGAGRLDLTDTGDITVLTRGDDPGTGGTIEIKHQRAATALTRTAPAVVLSTGPNGLGGIGAATGTPLAPPGGGAADEIENADADAMFVSRIHSRGAATCDDSDETSSPPRPSCEFDDILVWISAPVLMARLVEARVLP